MNKVLILVANVSLAQEITNTLEEKGLDVEVCHFLKTSLKKLDRFSFDLAIVDRIVPDGYGIELVEQLNETSFHTRIMVISDKNTLGDKLTSLKKGADDYLAKPFDLRELELRISKLRFKRKIMSQTCLLLGDRAKFFPDEGLLYLDKESKRLRRRESEMLHCLLSHKNRVVTKSMIKRWVWGYDEVELSRSTIEVYIKRLRNQLQSYGDRIETIRGFGYRYLVEADK